MTEVVWEPKRDLSFEEWAAAGEVLGYVNRSSPWWVGDWAAYGQRYGERYARAQEITGLSYSTIANYVSVASKVQSSRRRESLSWRCHAEVAALPAREQDDWLGRAERQGWGSERLRSEVAKAGRQLEVPEPPVEPGPQVMSGWRCPHCQVELSVEELPGDRDPQ